MGTTPIPEPCSKNIRANLTGSDRRQIEKWHAARASVLDHSEPEKGFSGMWFGDAGDEEGDHHTLVNIFLVLNVHSSL